MCKNRLIQLSILIAISLLPSGFLYAQKILDHEVFLKRIKNSEDNIYKECIAEYDDYLKEFPDNISVLIEKCKFIEYAQYVEDEEYNPNQEQFDSCIADLVRRFPSNPEVLLYQTTNTWGDERKKVFENATEAIKLHPGQWTKNDKALLFKAMADHYYYESDYKSADLYIRQAIWNDAALKTSLDYARILIELNRNEEAYNALVGVEDSTTDTWQLKQKADLLLRLKVYPKALDIYNKIRKIDSTYINNDELASTFEGVHKFDLARECLIADTSKTWDKEATVRNLLKHDLKYQDGAKCISTYNAYRDFGFSYDPLSLYRIKLFLSHPLQPWKFRDMFGLSVFFLVLVMLVAIPYIWILPVYFAGNRFSVVSNKKPFDSPWGLKMFWLVSSGYLFASLIAAMVDPEILHSLFRSSYQNIEFHAETSAMESLIFIIILTIFILAAIYKKNFKVIFNGTWPVGKTILAGFGVLFVFRIITAIYVQIGVRGFGISIEELAYIQDILFASKQEIEAIISTFGNGIAILLIGLIVPFTEEILFRGVVLGSTQRYINFNLANTFQAALFATIHMSLFLFPIFFLFGFTAGIMRKKSGGLLPGIVFHSLNNLLVLFAMIVRQNV